MRRLQYPRVLAKSVSLTGLDVLYIRPGPELKTDAQYLDNTRQTASVMQSSDASRDPEGLFSTYAHPQTSRRLNGFDPAHTQQYDGQLSMADLPVPTQVLGRGSEGCVDFGSSSSSLWRRQDSPQPASSSVSYSKGSNSSSPAWGGSLWSDSGNIWSTGKNASPDSHCPKT